MNRVVLMGRLVRDSEIKYTANGTCVANFSLAVNRRFVKEGEQQADFINIVAWSKTAEFVGKYFNKGLQVAVEGRIQTRNYENNEGRKVYVTEVVADAVYFADSKKESDFQPQSDNANITNDNPFEGYDMEDGLPF